MKKIAIIMLAVAGFGFVAATNAAARKPMATRPTKYAVAVTSPSTTAATTVSSVSPAQTYVGSGPVSFNQSSGISTSTSSTKGSLFGIPFSRTKTDVKRY